MTKIVEVAAAILLRQSENGTEYFLAQRPKGKVYAGYWEFPGGKVEPGETLHDALIREIEEELGVTVDRTYPWLSCQFAYPHATVRLKFFQVASWHGEVAPIEHSGFVWVRIGDAAPVSPVLPANGPILRALELPSVYAITNACENGVDAELVRLNKALADGVRLIQVRDKALQSNQRKQFAQAVMALAREHDNCCILVNDDATLARNIGAHGLHLSSRRLMETTERPACARVAASCHKAEELAHAASLGLDLAVLGPVLPTASHPESHGLGWAEFGELIEKSPIPVFALGGMSRDLLETARRAGAHGIAMMRGW
jgi:8-oxo-dGTP diphosphatase